MTPELLTLEGWAGIHDGLGKDRITLDLRPYAQARLIALVGPNGSGKSTLLDHLVPYRIMPSRTVGTTPGSCSLYDHIHGGTARKNYIWTHASKRYRSEWVVTTLPRRATRAYLYEEQLDGTWQPVVLPDGTRSDGKTDTYDACVEGILGPPALFLTSAFTAQGRPLLHTYSAGEIKTLIAQLINLSATQALGKKAQETAHLVRATLDGWRQVMAQVSQQACDLPGLTQRTQQIAQDMAQAEAIVGQAQQDLLRAQKNLEDAEHAQEQDAAWQTQRAHIESVRAEQDRQAAARREQRRAQRARLTQERERVTGQLAARREQAARARALRDSERARLRKLVEILPAISEAEAALPALRARLEEARVAYQQTETAYGAYYQTIQARTTAKHDGEIVKQQLSEHQKHLAMMEKQASGLARVPCSDQPPLQAACPLLTDARSASQEVRSLSQLVAQATKALEAARTAYRTLPSPEYASDAEAKSALATAKGLWTSAEQAVVHAEHILGQRAGAIEAKARLQALDDEEPIQAGTLARDLATNEARISEINREMQEITDTESQESAAAKQSEATAQAALAALPPAPDPQAIPKARQALADIRARLDAAMARLASLRDQQAATQGAHAVAVAAMAQKDLWERRITAGEEEHRRWSLLARGLGQDGVVALAIDDAGPTLAGIANDLLLAVYGPRFTLSLKTQTETQKGTMKEDFTILVHDAASGTSKTLEMLSGGQKVWVNDCLTRAIALYAARIGNRHYETLFSDEADGPLDPERKRHYLQVKRTMLDRGGYRQEIYISQSPEIWGLADAKIMMHELAS